MKHLLFFLVLFTLLAFGCKSDLKQGEESLEGTWKVEQKNILLGVRSALGVSIDSSFTEAGDADFFSFGGDVLQYYFHLQDSLYEDETQWILIRKKVNEGFTKVEQYTLQTDQFDFRCAFGDETSDAEKKATEITLSYETPEIGPYRSFILRLKKEK